MNNKYLILKISLIHKMHKLKNYKLKINDFIIIYNFIIL